MARRALIVGIDNYENLPSLVGSVNDALAMGKILQRNDDGGVNYDCHVLTSFNPPAPPNITKKLLRQHLIELFKEFYGDVLFYFSGHGVPTDTGGYLVTQEGEQDDYGLSMNELLTIANNSKAKSVLLILDCCSSGEFGNLVNAKESSGVENQALLREGLTILTASRPNQNSAETGLHGVFTDLILGALRGGAADVRGQFRRLRFTLMWNRL